MKVTATPIKGHELKAGDLFSTRGNDYWQDMMPHLQSIGEAVTLYIRTNTPALVAPDANLTVYKITIDREDA